MELTVQQARHIVNALKNGVVPRKNLEYLTVARDREVKEFQRCLLLTAEGEGVVKFLSGEYGSGKSFLINLIKHLALEDGFVVAKIQIDRSLRFNNLENVYYHIMHNLSTSQANHSGTSFKEIFDTWIRELQLSPQRESAAAKINEVVATLNQYNHSFARAFFSYIKAQINKDVEMSNAIASWMTGEQNIPHTMKQRFDIIGKIDETNSMDFLQAFVKLVTLLGYKGLVILVDELELIMNERVNIRRTSYENLRNIIDTCCSGEINNTAFFFASTADLFDNEAKGIKTYQALYQRLGNAIDKTNSSLTDVRQPIVYLRKLNMDNLQELTDRIIALYNLLYNLTPQITPESIRNWALLSLKKSGIRLSEMSLREFLVKLIEVLDIIEQHPNANIFKSELKTVHQNDSQIFVHGGSKG